MSETRRVLAVDEQRATLDFLRSVLPLIEGESFEIQRTFSAEEGLLELRRQPYDLLITGLRLPGMDGLELSKRAKSLRPYLPIVLAADRPLAELRDMAESSGVDYLLRKPLDAEKFLDAVQESLAAVPPAATMTPESQATESQSALPNAIMRRLETLCDETGAGQVLLSTVAGEILYATGGQLHGDIPRLVATTAASVSRGLDLSRQLNEREPRAVQFVEGQNADLYWANVGSEHFIAILFDAQVRRGRIGTVWVFTQRAVNDLKSKLNELPADSLAGSFTPEPASVSQGSGDAKTAEDIDPGAEVAAPPLEEAPAVAQAPEAPATVLGSEYGAPQEPERSPAEQELDAFWEEALASEAGSDALDSGLSFEEAKALGLVAQDFDPDELEPGADG